MPQNFYLPSALILEALWSYCLSSIYCHYFFLTFLNP
uniref:Uncharacterized protein n=1 Tax=Rhizophora mucronata TaxID=61149 RepID=A0A2P2NII5_RHIMU